MATEPSGLPNALLLILALEHREAVHDFAASLPRIDADHRAMLGAARVLLAQVPLGALADGPLRPEHVERIELAIALSGLALRLQQSE